MPNSPLADAAELWAAFPEWKELARVETDDSGNQYLLIEVKSPAATCIGQGLVIDTSNDEITVSFDHYHSHFDEWLGDGDQIGTLAALEFIKQLVNERVAVASWWEGEQWRGSTQIETGSPVENPSWIDTGADLRLRVRSWNGTYNADSDA